MTLRIRGSAYRLKWEGTLQSLDSAAGGLVMGGLA